MNSTLTSVGGNQHAEDLASAESEGESSSSSSSSSSGLSSSVNSDIETEATESDAVKNSTDHRSVKNKSSASSSASKSDERKIKIDSNMTEEADNKKSKPPFPETIFKTSSTAAKPKSDELPNLSVKKFAVKKSNENFEDTKVETSKEGSEKVKTKSDELSKVSVKIPTVKKLSEVERENPNELSEKSSKFSGIRKKIDKDLSAAGEEEAVKDETKEKNSKESPETPSTKDSSDKNHKGTPGKVSKLSSGWLKKFENPTENNNGREVSRKNSTEKLPGVKLRKTSVDTKGEETKEEESCAAVVSCFEKKIPVAERASNEQSEKTFKVPKLKRSSDQNLADNRESFADSSAKSSCDVKENISKETVNQADISAENIAKESLLLSAKDISEGTRDDDAGLAPEITSSKEAAKKRRKSPVNDVTETAERDEEEKETDKSAVVYRKKSSTEDGTVKSTVGDSDEQNSPTKTRKGRPSKSPIAAVDSIISINVEPTCSNPRDVKPTVFGTVEGEAVAKETERKEYGEVVDDVDGKFIASKKAIDVAIKVVIDERDAKSEVPAKATISEKTPEKPDIAAHRSTVNKPHVACQGAEDLTPEATEDAADEATREGRGEEEGGEVPVLNRSESVDDFIQKILSEVRGPDWRLKESEQELQETRLEPTDGEPRRETKSKAEENETETETTRKPPPTNKSVESRAMDHDETKQRSARIPVDEGEKQAVIAKYLRKKERQSTSDVQDFDSSKKKKLDSKRSINAEELLLRLERRTQNEDFESNHAPYATTLAGPKVSRGKLKRFNFGDGNFREKGEEISKFRQERLPDEAFRPRRSEGTSAVVRQKSRGVRSLVENQSEVIDAVRKASGALDELEQELDGVKQLSLGYRRRVEELEKAFDAETKAYESEYRTAAENSQQRSVQPKNQKKKKKERKENFLDLMFDRSPTVIDAEFDAFSTPAVASFLNRYGSSETSFNRGPAAAISGLVDQPVTQDFGSEAGIKFFSSKVDEYLGFAPERRIETTAVDRMHENGRELFDATVNISRLVPSAVDTRIEMSSFDEFLNRVESKYSTLSPVASLPDSTRSLKLVDIVTAKPSFSGFDAPEAHRPSRQLGRLSNGGHVVLTPDRVLPWTEKGTGLRSGNFGNELHVGGHLKAKSNRSKGEADSYTVRPISIGPRSRRK